jgi:hypothetical protein
MLDHSLQGISIRFLVASSTFHQYAIPWENWLMAASRWPQALHDGYMCWFGDFFQAFWTDIELMLTQPTRACLSIERKVKGSEVVNAGVGIQRTKHCVTRLTVISRTLTVLEWFAKENLIHESIECLVNVICNAILKEFSNAGSLLYKKNTPKQTQLPPTAHSLVRVLYTSSSVQVCIGFANNRLA